MPSKNCIWGQFGESHTKKLTNALVISGCALTRVDPESIKEPPPDYKSAPAKIVLLWTLICDILIP